MALPKKVKKYLPLTPTKVGDERRQQMLDDITDNGTYLPKSVLHADMDRGILDFIKNDLKLVVDGKTVPTVDKIITTQSWAQFTETWKFQDLDKNVSLPFIITIRKPEVKYGKLGGNNVFQNIPERLRFFYYTVPNWDGQRKGADVYKIPQPIPVDITYNVKIFCNRMREINEFNKLILQKFTSKQAYTQINGHYMPIVAADPTDDSPKEIEKRKYYIMNYEFTLNGFLIDDKEFQVSPAISRQVSLFEFETSKKSKRVKIEPSRPKSFNLDFKFVSGNTQLSEVFRYTVDLKLTEQQNLISCYNTTYSAITNTNLTYINCSGNTINLSLNSGNTNTICVKGGTVPNFSNTTGGTLTEGVSCASGFSVYINGNYIGDDLSDIQINDGDTLLIQVYKEDNTKESIIKTNAVLV